MIKEIKSIKKKVGGDELIKSSIILFIMINLFNALNYIYHFSMARMLGPADYGVLAVLFSFVYIFTIPTEAIQNVITSYTSKFSAKNENGKIKYMLFRSLKKGFLISSALFILFLPVAFFISNFLKIDGFLLVITSLLIFFFIAMPILRGILQGKKRFFNLGFSMVIEGFLKVILGISIVIAGWKVYGAIFAVITAAIISFLICFLFLKDILKEKRKEEDFKEIYSFSVPFFVSVISIILIYSLDIIFAKKFFSPEIAGKYAVASMLGKMIFFGTFAISKAMFPLASEKNQDGEKTSFLLKKSLKLIALVSGTALLFYLFLPSLLIKILYGKQYADASNILFFVGLAFTLLSFTNLIVLYELSTNRIKKSSFFLMFFVILEISLFYIFHDSLLEFSLAFLFTNLVMFLYSLALIKRRK